MVHGKKCLKMILKEKKYDNENLQPITEEKKFELMKLFEQVRNLS